MIRKLFFITVFILALIGQGRSETYYVRQGGNDDNSGTGTGTGDAWATIDKAVSTMSAGDICYVMDDDGGAYSEVINIDTDDNNGSNGSEITLAVRDGDTVTLQASGDWAEMIKITRRDYWIIDGFQVHDGEHANIYTTYISGGSHNIIRNITIASGGGSGITRCINFRPNLANEDWATDNLFEDIDCSAITQTTTETGYIGASLSEFVGTSKEGVGATETDNIFRRIEISAGTEAFDVKQSAKDSIIEYCKLYGQTQCAILTAGQGTIIRYNSIEGSADTLSYGAIWGCNQTQIYGNIVWDYTGGNYWKAGISLIGQTDCAADTISNGKIYNNTIYNCKAGIYLEDDNGGTNEIKNNICSECEGYELYAEDAATDGTVSHNDYYDDSGNVIYWGAANQYSCVEVNAGSGPGGANDMCANPLFTNPGNDGFTLQPGSPCNCTGVDLGDFHLLHPHPGASWVDDVWLFDPDIYCWTIGAYGYYSKPIIN